MAKIGFDAAYPLSGMYQLQNNITLADWLPIGDETLPFTGVFDGNEKTITLSSFAADALSNNSCLGIFGYVKGISRSAKMVIKNLMVVSSANAEATGGGQVIGLVAGIAEMAEIENITISGTLDFESSGTIRLGGAVGSISGETFIRNSSSSLAMNISPGDGSDLPDGGGFYSYVGGFAGMFRGGAGIENCHNTGNVTVDNTINNVIGQVFTGGVAGGSVFDGSTSYKGYIKDSSSTGTIIGRARGNWTFTGGIAGTIVGGGDMSLENSTRIEHCFAAGTVSVAGTGSAYPYVGGLVGYNYYGALVTRSYFSGTVIADKAADYTGGIAGYNSQTAGSNSRIEDCWSGGTIQGFNNAGGIAGQNQINTSISRCYSIALIKTTNNAGSVGGIAGLNTSTISACVALNPSISAPAGNNIHRVTGTITGSRSNNHAWSEMPVTTGGTYTEAKGPDAADGDDCADKPDQAFYETTLGWDFSTVWKMGADGYPVLR